MSLQSVLAPLGNGGQPRETRFQVICLLILAWRANSGSCGLFNAVLTPRVDSMRPCSLGETGIKDDAQLLIQ
jgi:hypothetical protein